MKNSHIKQTIQPLFQHKNRQDLPGCLVCQTFYTFPISAYSLLHKKTEKQKIYHLFLCLTHDSEYIRLLIQRFYLSYSIFSKTLQTSAFCRAMQILLINNLYLIFLQSRDGFFLIIYTEHSVRQTLLPPGKSISIFHIDVCLGKAI